MIRKNMDFDTRPCGPRRSTPKIWAEIHDAVQEAMVVV